MLANLPLHQFIHLLCNKSVCSLGHTYARQLQQLLATDTSRHVYFHSLPSQIIVSRYIWPTIYQVRFTVYLCSVSYDCTHTDRSHVGHQGFMSEYPNEHQTALQVVPTSGNLIHGKSTCHEKAPLKFSIQCFFFWLIWLDSGFKGPFLTSISFLSLFISCPFLPLSRLHFTSSAPKWQDVDEEFGGSFWSLNRIVSSEPADSWSMQCVVHGLAFLYCKSESSSSKIPLALCEFFIE